MSSKSKNFHQKVQNDMRSGTLADANFTLRHFVEKLNCERFANVACGIVLGGMPYKDLDESRLAHWD